MHILEIFEIATVHKNKTTIYTVRIERNYVRGGLKANFKLISQMLSLPKVCGIHQFLYSQPTDNYEHNTKKSSHIYSQCY